MAKRRAAMGKKGKHSRDGLILSKEFPERKRRKKRLAIITVIIMVLAVILASLLYIYFQDTETKKEKDVLSTDTPHSGGNPNEGISFSFTIYNPDKEPDRFSPLISGLPPSWTITLPDTISVEGKETIEKEFTITPAPTNALNKTYPFMLNLTSRNTQHTYTLEYELTIFHTVWGIEISCYNNSHHADPGRPTYYAIIVKNTGNGNDTVDMSYNESQLPKNWTLSFEFDQLDIPVISSRVVICEITTHEDTPKGRYDIDIYATSLNDDRVSVRVNTSLIKDFDDRTAIHEDLAQVNYIGTLTDGLIFDTSIFEIANNSDYPKGGDFNFRGEESYMPLKMYVGGPDPDTGDLYGDLIDGFWEGVIGMKANETKVVRIPPEKGYYKFPEHGLYGKTLIFEITLVSIDS